MLVEIGYTLLGLFMLFVPGFLLTLVFYPKVEQLDFWERVGVSVGLGVLVLIYVGVVLAKPEWKMLTLTPFVAVVVAFSCVCAGIAYWRGGFKVLTTYIHTVLRAVRRPKPKPPQAQPAEGQPKR